MNHTSGFCTFCGNQLASGARFCGNCGHRIEMQQAGFADVPIQQTQHGPAPLVTPPPPQKTAPQAVPSAPGNANHTKAEVVLKVLPILQRRKGLFGSQSFAVVLTSHRLIFALVTSQMLQEAAKDARQQAREQGKGFFEQWAAMTTSGWHFSQRYLGMAPATILAEHGENFYFLHNQIQQVRLKSSDPEEPNDRDQVEIDSNGTRHRYTIAYGSLKEVREALKPLYGNRVN